MELIVLLAFVPPFLYAANTHFDNIILKDQLKANGDKVSILVIFSTLLSVLALPTAFFSDDSVFAVETTQVATLALVAVLKVVLLWCYLSALDNDEPLVTVIYYQMVPVLGMIFGATLLGESVSDLQIVGVVVIIAGVGALTMSLDEEGRVRFKLRSAFLMTIASACWAMEAVLFRMTALEADPWRSLFWESAFMTLIGVGILLFIPRFRRGFRQVLRSNGKAVIGLNSLNEAVYVVGSSAESLVVSLLPAWLVLAMNSFELSFVLLLGIFLTFAFPKIEVEHVSQKNLLSKVLAIGMTVCGFIILMYDPPAL